MSNTISASLATATNATDSAPSVNARLLDLIQRAETSAMLPTTNKRNKALLKDLCFAVVALAQRVAELQAKDEQTRIVVP